jgi:hypothetical protein
MADKDEKLIQEAKQRFQRCEDHEAEVRPLFKEDLRFANADPDNGYQWPTAMRRAREADSRPCLTINKVKQHNRQITNDARQNKPSVRVYPVDSGADQKTADILNGIIRHIEANSSADTAYDTAAEFAVDAGIGYWRVVTDYVGDDTFDQEIFIKRVKNPLNIYLDPDIQEADGSDARFGFVFEDMPKDEFEASYPNAEPVNWDAPKDVWCTKDTIRVAEYFKKTESADTLFSNGMRASELSKEDLEVVKAQFRSRPVKRTQVMWNLLAGDQVLEKKEWPGKYIPIVRVIGEEVEIDGKVERKGHTRAMKDAQRMYNYWTSSAVEHVALQSKVPFVGPVAAREGLEEYWNTANTANHSYLPYNHVDDDGSPVPPPQRQQPPVMAAAYMQGMQVASEEMKMASGQYDASMGAKSNETSGRAIMARQREGDVATFHFIDNIARAIKYTGKILVDLIPKIYDTERVVRILGEDGKDDKVRIDPNQEQAYVERKNLQGEIEEIYNPNVGRYDVTVAVGPSYSTRRQEAFYALNEMASRNPAMMQVAGDLVMKAADFPMAEELAQRFEKTLPPGLADESGQSPEVAALKQQLQQMQGQMQALAAEAQKLDESKEMERQKLLIERYKAETERLKLIYPAMPAPLAVELAADMGLQAANSPDIMPPDPMQQQPMQQQPAQAGFFTPEGV